MTINVSCAASEPGSDVVTATVTWQLPPASAAAGGKRGRRATWNSTILVQYWTPEGPHVNTQRTSADYIQLSLAVDYVYEISVHVSPL